MKRNKVASVVGDVSNAGVVCIQYATRKDETEESNGNLIHRVLTMVGERVVLFLLRRRHSQ